MGLYSSHIFPYLMNQVMSNKAMTRSRAELLVSASGEIFEIGFGTGLNLKHYPSHVKKITTADVNAGMGKLAQRSIDASPIEVDNRVLNGEDLPLTDESFDTVVCTWTLCSIPNVEQALKELHRILKPGGQFLFVEHGLADNPKTQRMQHRVNPLWKLIGDGCHLNRNITELIQDHHFLLPDVQNFYMPGGPRFASYMYQGVATKG